MKCFLEGRPRPAGTPVPHDFLAACGDGAVEAPVEDLGVEGVVFSFRFEVVWVGWVGEVVLCWGQGGAVDGVGMGFVAVGEDLVGSEEDGGRLLWFVGDGGRWRGGGGVVVERRGRGYEGFYMVVVDKRRGAGEEGAGHGRLSVSFPFSSRSLGTSELYAPPAFMSDSAGPYREIRTA